MVESSVQQSRAWGSIFLLQGSLRSCRWCCWVKEKTCFSAAWRPAAKPLLKGQTGNEGNHLLVAENAWGSKRIIPFPFLPTWPLPVPWKLCGCGETAGPGFQIQFHHFLASDPGQRHLPSWSLFSSLRNEENNMDAPGASGKLNVVCQLKSPVPGT